MTPRIHHTVHPDVRPSLNEWYEYISEEHFRMLFNNLKEKINQPKYER